MAYDSTDVFLITFSVVSRQSFRNVKEMWFKELEKNRSKLKNARVRKTIFKFSFFSSTNIFLSPFRLNFQIVLVGTKSDQKGLAEYRDNPYDEDLLKDNPYDEDITKAEGDLLAWEIDATCYIETSSKTGDGVKEVFDEAIRVAMLEGKADTGCRCIII